MKTLIFATTLLMSTTLFAQDVGDAPMAEAPVVEMAQEQNKADFMAPAATEEDMKQIQQAEKAARAKDKKMQKAAAKMKKPSRAPASVSEPEFEKKKNKSRKKKKKKAHM